MTEFLFATVLTWSTFLGCTGVQGDYPYEKKTMARDHLHPLSPQDAEGGEIITLTAKAR